MDLTHEFTVPATAEETWDAFNDIEAVAGCFPGATVTAVEGDTFQGSCKVKLGPIALVYNGSGTFVEKDEASRTMRIEAKGKDKRGNGTAGADVTATMVETAGSTTVTVVTDLAITGKPAQFGRGVIQDVSDKLLGQFVDCLADRLGDRASDEGLRAAAATTGHEPAPSATPAAGVAAGTVTGSVASGDSAIADARRGDDVQDGLAASGGGPSHGQEDDALDLGAAVLPVLLRSYGKQVAAALAILFLLGWLVRRRG